MDNGQCCPWTNISPQSVILSERERVERSSHDRDCLADIWCEDPSTSLRFAQDDALWVVRVGFGRGDPAPTDSIEGACRGRVSRPEDEVWNTTSVTACAVPPVCCGKPGRGSDSPPDCHSLPRLRFAYLKEKAWVQSRNDTEQCTVHSAQCIVHSCGVRCADGVGFEIAC